MALLLGEGASENRVEHESVGLVRGINTCLRPIRVLVGRGGGGGGGVCVQGFGRLGRAELGWDTD